MVHRTAFAAMAGHGEIRMAGPDAATCAHWAGRAVDEVRRIETAYSRYREDSIVSRINAAAGKDWVGCDEEAALLLGYADSLYRASGGLFDITSGTLRRAWNFRLPRVPAQAELAPLLALVGWDKVQREEDRIRLPLAGMEIDFGGFGKEYAADRAAALLEGLGVRHGYVNLGGDMRFIGPQPDGSPWRIGIQHPRRMEEVAASIEVSHGALATSGDYERFFDMDGERYCHVLDPRSGMPVRYWQSVSVLAPLAVVAGSWSTIAMLKQDKGEEFLREAGVRYLAIDGSGVLHCDAGKQ